MSRRKARQARLRAQRRASVWTIQRASGVGIVCGILAVLVAGLFSLTRDGMLYPYAVLLALTAFCGASILWITAFDMRSRGTSGKLRAIRAFDIVLGLTLLLPSLYALRLIWSDLEL